VAETGGGGPDGGVDLRLQRDGMTSIVQCKRWKYALRARSAQP
jgi:restriction system protein